MEKATPIHFTDDANGYGPLYVGRTFEAVITITGTDGLPADLSNYTVASQARASSDSVEPAWTFAASIVDVELNGQTYPKGGIKLFLGASAAVNLQRGRYWWDARLTSTTDNDIVVSPVAGWAQVEPVATR